MADTRRRIFTIPAQRAFADALAAGLIAAHPDPLDLARGVVLLPNNRAKLTIRDAFVRASQGGLLLPRLVAIGDAEEGIAAAFDPADEAAPVPPAMPPLRRRMMLAKLIADTAPLTGRAPDGAEAVRLAGDLARTLDQLLVEEVEPAALRAIDPGQDLTEHWQNSLQLFELVVDRWPEQLARVGMIDLPRRRTLLLGRLAERWRRTTPAGFVCAAGITTAAPAVAALLDTISRMPGGSVVLPGLDLAMPEEEWMALGPHDPDPATGRRPRAIESHPQFQLKLLLDGMNAGRGEVRPWRGAGGPDAGDARGRAVANALSPALFTGKWQTMKPRERKLDGVRLAAFATQAEEAQAIALALRGVLETPGKTGALVTPDRGLARRVAVHLGRWGIAADDTAGRPLALTPPGTLLIGLAEAAAQRFAPLALLALAKHPLVQAGPVRIAWLDSARRLDLALRGPRPAPGLAGIDAHLAGGLEREQRVRRAAQGDWQAMRPLFTGIEGSFAAGAQSLPALIGMLREAAQGLCGDALWTGPAGRAAAELLADLEATTDGPAAFEPASLPALLADLMSGIAVRPPQGGHPRIAIYGLIEARLQTADLMVLGGLNEGVWPASPTPDPWLAPRIRSELGLPGVDRRIGLSAHDFASALGAPEVLITRARRDARGPAIASRLWLRLEAMIGEQLSQADDLIGWAHALDEPGLHEPAERPEPVPPAELRPKRISVTEVDRLKADPYAFYAGRVLGLGTLDAVDADPGPAWRGTAVHDVLEKWFSEDRGDPARLRERMMAMLADERTHPMVRALWQPRLLEAVEWVAAKVATQAEAGRTILAVEGRGELGIAGVRLSGRFDRIDLTADGGIAIVDYKTGKAPSAKAVAAGFSLQLGLLGAIAEAGGFAGVGGRPGAFEYWSLAKGRDGFGHIASPVDPAGKRDKIVTADFTQLARDNFTKVAGRWLTGSEPFTAKLHPEYAPYADYDQLMRRDEWYGRERG